MVQLPSAVYYWGLIYLQPISEIQEPSSVTKMIKHGGIPNFLLTKNLKTKAKKKEYLRQEVGWKELKIYDTVTSVHIECGRDIFRPQGWQCHEASEILWLLN